MPQVPMQSWDEIAGLRKSKRFKNLVDEGVELARQEKLIKTRRAEISFELYGVLESTLDKSIKSIDYEGTVLTRRNGGPTKRFDKSMLFSFPIPCSNPKCKTENHFPVDGYEQCQKKGKDSEPGVSFKLPGEQDEE